MPVLPPWAPSVCVSLCICECVRVSSLLLTLACRCAKIIKRTRVGHFRVNRKTSGSRSLYAFSHIHAPAPACIRFLIHMRPAALTSTWATNSQTTFNKETRASHCPLRMIASVVASVGIEEHSDFIWYWAVLKEQITPVTQPHVIPNSHEHISLMHTTQ